MVKSPDRSDEKQPSVLKIHPKWLNSTLRKSRKENHKSVIATKNGRTVILERINQMKINRENACLISPAFIKICCIGTIITWFSTLILGVLMAQLDPAGPNFDPAGFNPLINYLSNLGSIYYTPFPCVFNFGLTLTSLLTIPIAFYIKNLMVGEYSNILRNILAVVFTILLVLGLIFLALAGLVNSELSKIWEEQLFFPLNACNWHLRIANFAFSGLVFAGGVFALFSLVYTDFFREKFKIRNVIFMKTLFIINSCVITPVFLGFFMSSPLLHSEDLFWFSLPLWKWATFWEWCLAISLTFSLIFLCSILLRPLNLALKKTA
jgi:hypothetical protein